MRTGRTKHSEIVRANSRKTSNPAAISCRGRGPRQREYRALPPMTATTSAPDVAYTCHQTRPVAIDRTDRFQIHIHVGTIDKKPTQPKTLASVPIAPKTRSRQRPQWTQSKPTNRHQNNPRRLNVSKSPNAADYESANAQ